MQKMQSKASHHLHKLVPNVDFHFMFFLWSIAGRKYFMRKNCTHAHTNTRVFLSFYISHRPLNVYCSSTTTVHFIWFLSVPRISRCERQTMPKLKIKLRSKIKWNQFGFLFSLFSYVLHWMLMRTTFDFKSYGNICFSLNFKPQNFNK